MDLEKINDLSSKTLDLAREQIEKALEEHFFDSSMDENDRIKYINFAQIVAQISTTVTAGVILQLLSEDIE